MKTDLFMTAGAEGHHHRRRGVAHPPVIQVPSLHWDHLTCYQETIVLPSVV